MVSKYRGRASADPEAVQRDVYLREKVYRLQDLVVNWKPRIWKDLMIWRVDKSTGFLGDLLRPSGALQNDLFPIDTLAAKPPTQMENEESASDIDLSRGFQPDINFGYTDRMPMYIYVTAVGSQRLNDIVVTTDTSTLPEIATQPSVPTDLTMTEQDSIHVRTPTACSILSRSDRESMKSTRTSRRSGSIFSRRGHFKPQLSRARSKVSSLLRRTSLSSLTRSDGDQSCAQVEAPYYVSSRPVSLSSGSIDSDEVFGSSIAPSLKRTATDATSVTDRSGRREKSSSTGVDDEDKGWTRFLKRAKVKRVAT